MSSPPHAVRRRVITPIAAAVLSLLAGGVAAAPPIAAARAPNPSVVKGVRLTASTGDLNAGTIVAQHAVGQRIFRTASDGFGLADAKGRLYPALTVNGGRTWRLAGPSLIDVSAAQAPLVVDEVGEDGPQTLYAYGGGQVIDITTDGGRDWWRATFQGLQVAVGPLGQGKLAAFIDTYGGRTTRTGTEQFVTIDGGRRWSLTDR